MSGQQKQNKNPAQKRNRTRFSTAYWGPFPAADSLSIYHILRHVFPAGAPHLYPESSKLRRSRPAGRAALRCAPRAAPAAGAPRRPHAPPRPEAWCVWCTAATIFGFEWFCLLELVQGGKHRTPRRATRRHEPHAPRAGPVSGRQLRVPSFMRPLQGSTII